jgi:Mg2+/Co2+ transporter CorB
LIVVPAPALPLWLETLVGVANAVLSIILCVLVVLAIPAVIALRRSVRQVAARADTVLQHVTTDVVPLLHDAAATLSAMQGIATTLHGDVRVVHDTVSAATAEFRRALGAAQERVDRLGALIDVAEDEVEDVLVTAIAAARGVRAGTAALRRGVNAALTFDSGDGRYGDERPRPAGDGHERPRVRPRREAPNGG